MVGDAYPGGAWPGGFIQLLGTPVNYQHQRPSADAASGSWTPTPGTPTTLYDKLNETSVDDSTYISATAV